MTNYARTIKYIKHKYSREDASKLIRYYDSEMFETDLRNLMSKQRMMGESLTRDLATECLFDSFIDEENEDMI